MGLQKEIGAVLGLILTPLITAIKFINNAVASLIRWVVDKLYIKPLSSFVSKELLRYALCGFTNYIVLDAILYFITYHYIVGADTYIYIGITTISPHILSMIVVFPITFITGFWLNRYVAFSSTHFKVQKQITRYALSIVGSILLSYIILKGLVEWLNIWPTPAKVICSLLLATYSFLMARYYTFPTKE